MLDLQGRSDASAVRKVLSGNREAFGPLVTRYHSLVYHVALSHAGNPADAEDLTQEAFLKAFVSLDTLQDANRFSAWLVTITRNLARDFLKRLRIRRDHARTLEETPPVEPDLEEAETRRVLWHHLNQLEESERELLVLHYFEGKRAKELAELYGISAEACAKRLQRARQTLATDLLASLGVESKREGRTDRVKAIMALVATAPAAWASAAAGTAAFAGLGMLKIAGALVVGAAAVGAAFYVIKYSPDSRSGTSGASAVATQAAGAEVEAAPAEYKTETTSSPAISDSGRRSDPRNLGPGEIYGVVIDEAGNPAPNVEVVVDGMKNDQWLHPDESEARRTIKSDESGAFSFTQLPAPYSNIGITYQVMAFAEGLAAVESVYLSTHDDPKELTLHLQTARTLNGTVLDNADKPVGGVRVYPLKTDAGESDAVSRAVGLSAVTDALGRFVLRGLVGEGWGLVAMAERFAPYRVDTEETVRHVEMGLDTGARIRGSVIDTATHKGAAGAHVLLVESTEEGSVALAPWNARLIAANADGAYEAMHVQPGRFHVLLATLHEDNWVYRGASPPKIHIDTSSGVDSEAPDLEVIRGGAVGGHVMDPATGAGMKDVQVTIQVGKTVAPARVRTTMKTDANGHYLFTGLRQGEHKIYLEQQSQRDSRVVTIGPGEVVEDIDFVHQNSARYAGTVVDESGLPVSGAIIRINSADAGNSVDAVSDFNGHFELRGLTPVDALFSFASTTRFRSEIVGPMPLSREGISDAKLVLNKPRTASVSGVVVDTQGRPMPKAHVNVEAPGPSWAYGGSTQADERGEFRVARLTQGDYTIQTTPAEQNTWSMGQGTTALTLAAGQEVKDLRLVHGAGELSISGRVMDRQGQPISGASIHMAGGGNVNVSTSRDGRFTLAGLAKGDYSLYISGESFSQATLESVAAGTSDIEVLLEKLGKITGRVERADSGEAVESFSLFAYPGAWQTFSAEITGNMAGLAHVVKSADGRFDLDGVQPGPATVVVSADGLAPGFAVVSEVPPGGTAEGVVVRLDPELTVKGRVTDADGKGVGGAKIVLGTIRDRGFQEPGISAPAALTEADGSFALGSLSETVRVISIAHPDYAIQVVPLQLLPGRRYAPVEVTLTRGGTVAGTVLLDGQAPPASMHYIRVDYPCMSDSTGIGGRVDSSGNYQLSGLAPGHARVTASLKLDAGQDVQLLREVPALIKEGETATVNIDLTSGTGLVEGHIEDPNDPPEGFSVRVQVETAHGTFFSQASLDPNQNFHVPGLPAGKVTLFYPSDALGRPRHAFDLAEGESRSQDIEIVGTGSMTCNVTLSAPNRRTWIILLAEGTEVSTMDGPHVQSLISQALKVGIVNSGNPHTQLRGVEPGTYTVAAISAAAWTEDGMKAARFATETVTVAEGEEEVNFKL